MGGGRDFLADLGRLPQAVQIYRELLGVYRLDAGVLRERRTTRLRRLLRHVYETVPFYRRRFDECGVRPQDVRSEADLALLPLTSKEELRALPLDEVLSSTVRRDRLLRHTTSGSTGTPFTFYRTPEAHLFHVLAHLRPMFLLGMTWWDRLFCIGHMAYLTNTWPQRVGVLPTVMISPLLPLSQQIEQMQRFRPTVLAAYPSAARAVASALLDGHLPVPRLRLAFTGGERLDEPTSRLMRRAFGITPLSLYGMLEVARIGWQCRPGSDFHTADDYLVLEVVRDGRPVADGEEGELVLTHLTKMDMPWIRYRTGDVVRRVPRACACTHALGQLDLVGGRINEVLLLPDGTRRSPLPLSSIIHTQPGIAQYQLRQERADAVVIRIVPASGYLVDTPQRLRALLTPLLPGVDVSVQHVSEISRGGGGKAAYIVVAPEVRAQVAQREAPPA